MKPDDYVAVIAYDLRSEILRISPTTDEDAGGAAAAFTFPDFSESNMFDALTDTADRMSKIEGRKAILLITSGIDTFSKLTFDKARKILQDSGVPIYSIGMLQIHACMADGAWAPTDIDFPAGR